MRMARAARGGGCLAVYRREIYSYYTTPQGYVFTGLFVLVLNLFFYFANVSGRVSSLGAAFAFMLTVLMLTVPVLTMRLFAEEYRRGTDRLLLTAPVTLRAVVMGKLIAAMTVFAVALSNTLIWAEIVALFGGLNTAEYIGNIFAMLAFASVYISLGLLVSALTGSQTVAVVASLGVFAALFLADVAVSIMPDAPATRFLASFSLFKRYDAFSRGVFSLTDIVFCVTACALFVFLTTAALSRRRSGLRHRWKRLLALAIPGLALLAAVNLFTSALGERYYLKLDMTRGRVFALTGQTVDILRALPEHVTITMLTPPSELSGVVYDDMTGAAYQLSDLREALEKYRSTSGGNLTFRYVDPELNPGWLQSRDLTGQAGYYSLIVESERRVRVLSLRDLFETRTMYDYDGAPIQEMTMGLKAESAITSAILNVVTERLPTAPAIQGHADFALQ
ncbi:MAG: ABC transporter permease subunit, partial [Oscillospiraceae bacterium]|nr:ABC transporter permease subunit [Oscillospiraceae bacterium]